MAHSEPFKKSEPPFHLKHIHALFKLYSFRVCTLSSLNETLHVLPSSINLFSQNSFSGVSHVFKPRTLLFMNHLCWFIWYCPRLNVSGNLMWFLCLFSQWAITLFPSIFACLFLSYLLIYLFISFPLDIMRNWQKMYYKVISKG